MEVNKQENPFLKYGEGKIEEINKSDVFEAMCEPTEGKLNIEKTGKDIKNQITKNLLPKLEVEFKSKLEEAKELLKFCGLPPTCPIKYYKIKLNLPFYEYCWFETYYKETSSVGSPEIFAEFGDVDAEESAGVLPQSDEVANTDTLDTKNYPNSETEAEYRQKYNCCVRELIEIQIDIRTLNVLLKLKESKLYSLTVNQSLALGYE